MRFIQAKAEHGFSLPELMVSLLIFLPITAATFSLFSISIGEHGSEQSSAEMTQEARSALELMTEEISQAGTRRDAGTGTTTAIAGSPTAQSVTVASSSTFAPGDYVEIDLGGNSELVQISAVGSNSITGVFRLAHNTIPTPVRLYSYPYLSGVIPPAGLGANSSTTTTTLRFFGDINSDGNVNFVEYAYDAANARITRSVTPLTQVTKNSPIAFISNIKAGSPQFTLYTDSLGIVTSVRLSFTVASPWKTGSKYQETPLSSTILIPSAVTASARLAEYYKYGGYYRFPPTPSIVTTWASE
jgi:prepilin-type N-terminal cleavage/methylation domain-containing protein